jgi:hypothetical protein
VAHSLNLLATTFRGEGKRERNFIGMSSVQGDIDESIKTIITENEEENDHGVQEPSIQLEITPNTTVPVPIMPSKDNLQLKNELLFGILPMKDFDLYLKAVAGIIGLYFIMAPQRFLLTVWNILMTTIGVALGIGLGAGLAMHVFHQLQSWQKDYDDKNKGSSRDYDRRRTLIDQIRPNKSNRYSHQSSYDGLNGGLLSSSTSSSLEDGNSYISLMAQAGYYIPDRVLRGQVLREDHKFWNIKYRFTDNKILDQKAVKLVATDWPSLPEPVRREMGRFIEHLMRDFISGWYTSLDNGIVYRDERNKREDGIPRDGGDDDEKYYRKDSTTTISETPLSPRSKASPKHRLSATKREMMVNSTGVTGGTLTRLSQIDTAGVSTSVASSFTTPIKKQHQEQNHEKRQQQQQPPHHVPRRMVFSTLTHRNVPMIDCTYRVMSTAFGNLASRAEHVNVLELAILKWTQVLGRSLKVYRTLRKAAQDKNHSQRPSEVQVTREFLLSGKLHRAVVFGLDIPSLLFADASGEECGCGTDQTPQGQLQVLEQRLYHTKILKECELDYNRVVANRLVRALLPKSESASTCVTALVVEIIASCVLQPLMNLWVPSFLNDIIVKSMDKPVTTGAGSSSIDDSSSTNKATSNNSRESSQSYSSDIPDEAKHAISAMDERNGEGNEILIEQGVPGKDYNDPQQSFSSHAPYQLLSTASASNQLGTVHSGDSIDDNDEPLEEMEVHDNADTSYGDKLLTLSATALGELGKQMDFEECRRARLSYQETEVDWDDADVGSVVLRLVMVVEAALLDGRCEYREPIEATTRDRLDLDTSLSNPNDETDEMDKESFVQLLMEMTSDMNAFEKRLQENKVDCSFSGTLIDHPSDEFEPNGNEISTLRTLISTWLHTGQLYKAISLIEQAASTVFAPFYASDAFLMEQVHRGRFLEQIKVLDGVDVMVETMAVLASQRLVVEEEFILLTSAMHVAPTNEALNSPSRSGHNDSMHSDHGYVTDAHMSSLNVSFGGQSTSRYQDFHRNEAFAASLRAERERRLRAWETTKSDDGVMTVIRKTATKKNDLELHRELHKLAFVLYNGTSLTTIRDAARKSDAAADHGDDGNAISDEKVSLLTVETASTRRRIEVPDDDSSFLLRAQSRPLNPLSVHRDDRNHDMSYKCFLATYEEPAIAPGSTRYNGGRFIRRCFLQYYPSDRTASIVPMTDARKLDKRKSKLVINDEGGKDLAASFLRQRHLCQKWTQSGGVSTKSFFDSKLMDPGDFVSAPRSGKAIEFVYKKLLFEPPLVDLGGKRFTVQDASAGRGVHRADASALEVSDASLSHLLLLVGKEYETGQTGRPIECGPDGYPMLFQKLSSKHGDQVNTEIKPYRLSFVRAALMVASSR